MSKLYGVTVGHHGGEEGVTGGALVRNGAKEVGIVEEYLVRLA